MANGVFPDANPGAYLYLASTGGHPGRSAGQVPGNTVDRYAIAAYTVSSGGEYFLTDSFLDPAGTPGDGNEVVVLVTAGGVTTQVLSVKGDDSTFSFNSPLGWLSAGDVIYVASGPDGAGAGNDDGSDGFNWDFSIRRNGEVRVDNGGTLGGTGVIGAVVTSAGILDAGQPADIGSLGTNSIILTGGQFRAQVGADDGTTPGVSNDVVNVTGSVALGIGAAGLNVTSLGTNPSALLGAYTLIANDGTDLTTGNFSGLSDGDVALTAGGTDFRIYYNGGDGNDVVLVGLNGTPSLLYVDDDWTAPAMVDGDSELAGFQTAYVGVDAFASIPAALAAYPAYAGTIIVNPGNYGDPVTLSANAVSLQFVGGDSSLPSLTSGADDLIALGGFDAGHTTPVILTLGAGSVASPTSGTGGLTKAGAASDTLLLSGINTYTGLTTVSAGTLQLGDYRALGGATAGTVIESGATLDLNGVYTAGNSNEPISVSGTGVGGNGAIVNTGAVVYNRGFGNLTLNGDTTIGGPNRWDIRSGITFTGNNYTLTKIGGFQIAVSSPLNGADIVLNAGRLTIQNSNALGTGGPTDTTTVNSGAVLGYYGAYTVPEKIIFNGGSLASENNDTTFTGPITMNVDTVVNAVAGGHDITITGPIDGAGGLTKNGTSTLTLTGGNTYGGTTTINAGTLSVSDVADNGLASNLGAGTTVAVNGNSVLQFTGAAADATDRTITLSGSSGANSPRIDVSNTGGDLQLVGATISGSGQTLGKIGAGTLTLGTGTSTSGTLSQLFAAGGNLTINGNASVNTSNMLVGANDAFIVGGGSGTLNIQDTATLTTANLRMGEHSAGPAQTNFVNQSGGTVTVTGASGNIGDTSGAFRIAHWGNETSTYNLSGGNLNITSDLSVGWDGAGVFTQTGGIATVNRLVVNDSNSLNSSGSGTFTLSNGLFQLGSGGIRTAGGSAVINLGGSGGTLQATANWDASLPMALSGTGTNAITVDTNGFHVALAGVLSGTGGGLNKSGSGTLTLSNNETYSGQTRVLGGTLALAHASNSNLASSPLLTLDSGAVLDVTGLSGGRLDLAGGQTLRGEGAVTGMLRALAGSTVQTGVAAPGVLTSGSATFEDGATFRVAIGGTSAGSGSGFHGQLMVNGAVSLGGATLDASLFEGFMPSTTGLETFVIIDNDDDGDAVAGVFQDALGNDLPEGSPVVAGGATLYITYAGSGAGNTTGNDVVLTSQPVVNGTPGPDTVILRRKADDSQFEFKLNNAGFVDLGNPAAFYFNGGAGDDVLIVDFVNGDALPGGGGVGEGVFFDGAAPLGLPGANEPMPTPGHGDVLQVTDSGARDEVAIYRPSATTPGAGTVTVTGRGVVTFTGLEPVDISNMATATLTLPGAADVVNMDNGFDAASGTIPALVLTGTSDSGSGPVAFESLHAWNNGTLVIDTTASDGDDALTINSADSPHGNVNLQIDTGTGTAAETLTVAGRAVFAGNVTIDTVHVNFTSGGEILAVGPSSTLAITAGGAIQETVADAGLELAAATLILAAATGIGAPGSELEINAGGAAGSGLTATVSGPGPIGLVDPDGLYVNLAQTNDGPILLAAGAVLPGDLTVVNATAGGSGDLLLGAVKGSVQLGSATADGNLVGIGAFAGAIVDINGTGNNVTAAALIMSARLGIGDPDPLDTAVSLLAAENNGSGAVQVINSGALTVTSLTVPGFGSVTGVTAAGPVALTVTDTAAASADHLTLNAAVRSTWAGVTLSAGDDFSLAAGGSVTAATTVVVNIDAGDADSGTGATALLEGPISSGGGATLSGNADADSVTVNRLGTGGLTVDAAGSGDTVTVNLGASVGAAIQSKISVLDTGASGTDQLYVTGGETLSDSFVIGAAQLQRDATETVTYDANLEELHVNGMNEAGTAGDTFTVTPSLTMKIFIDGDSPASVTPGDKLAYQTPAGQTATQTVSGPDSGTIDATGGYQQVTYREIESLAFGGDVVVNGTGLDDHMIVTATGEDSGSYVVWTDSGAGFVAGPTVGFAGLTKLTFNGLAGDDVLTIAYDPAATEFLNPQSGVFFNGGSQVNDGNALTPIDASLQGDTLQVFAPAGETADTVTHRLDPAGVPADGNDGLITIADASGMTDGSTTIAYTGLEPVLDAMPAVDRVFTFTAGAESVTLSTPGDGSLANKIDSTLSEATSFNNPAGSLTVNLTNDSDTLDVQSLNVPLPGIALTINGDGGDTVNFTTGTTNIGAGNANVGTTVGQPIQTINFNGGTLQTSGDVFLTAAGAIQTSDATLDVMADDLMANAGTGIGLDTTVAAIVAAVSGDGAIQIDETDGVTFSLTDSDGKVNGNVTAGNIVMGLDAQAPEGALRLNGSYIVNTVIGDTSPFYHDRVQVIAEEAATAQVTVNTTAGQWTSSSFVVASDTQLNVRLRDAGGVDPHWVLNALRVRPAPDQGDEIRISGPSGPLDADGTTVDTFTGTNRSWPRPSNRATKRRKSASRAAIAWSVSNTS